MSLLTTDQTLLARFRQGESGALAEVYQHYLPLISTVLRAGFEVQTSEGTVHVPGLTSAFEIEGACHEVFVRAFSPAARQAYDGLRPYGTYLFRIARNWRIDEHRRQHRLALMETVPEPEPPLTTALEERLLDEELSGLLNHFVGGLPTKDLLYYRARFEDGQSQTEAAATQGLSRIQGRRIEARIKTALARFLRVHGYGRS